MCRLIAISSNQPTNIALSLKEFSQHAAGNPHGFGFAQWRDGELIIEKSPSRLGQKASAQLASDIHSKIVLGHVRLQSVGEQSFENTHPFMASFGGKKFAFAHNGTVRQVKNWPVNERCDGDTDSEHAFRWMLGRLHDIAPRAFAQQLRQRAAEVMQLGNFNFVMSDGETLWAFAHNSLWVLERNGGYDRNVRLLRAGVSEHLADHKAPEERAVIVASERLTDEEGWRKVPAGTLLTMVNGAIVSELDASAAERVQVRPRRTRRLYGNLDELIANEPRDAWSMRSIYGDSPVTVVALHGGTIQPGTEAIATAIAGDDLNLFWFAGLRQPGAELHIDSAAFFEPSLDEVLHNSELVISINGFQDSRKLIKLSGGNGAMVNDLHSNLAMEGFEVARDDRGATNPNNIVNRSRGYGVQIDISMAQREAFFNCGSATAGLHRFISCVLRAIDDLLGRCRHVG